MFKRYIISQFIIIIVFFFCIINIVPETYKINIKIEINTKGIVKFKCINNIVIVKIVDVLMKVLC